MELSKTTFNTPGSLSFWTKLKQAAPKQITTEVALKGILGLSATTAVAGGAYYGGYSNR